MDVVIDVESTAIEEPPPEREELVVMLASLLNDDVAVARRALEHCQWCFELAVDAACEISAGSAASSSSSADVAIAQHADAASSSSSARIATTPHADTASSSSSTQSAQPGDAAVGACVKRRAADEAWDVLERQAAASQPVVNASSNAKRQRLTEEVASIKIPNTLDETPCPQPPMFLHPLRDEQLRSLAWMIKQETKSAVRTEDGASLMRGGILADQMGYGKTSTTIGLISLDAESSFRQPTMCTDKGRVPCDSTLVACPPHLVQQWLDEFWKFLGPTGVTIWTVPTASREKHHSCRWLRSVEFNVTLPFSPGDVNHSADDLRIAESVEELEIARPAETPLERTVRQRTRLVSAFGIYVRAGTWEQNGVLVTIILARQMEKLRRARRNSKPPLQPNDLIEAITFKCMQQNPDGSFDSITSTFNGHEIYRTVNNKMREADPSDVDDALGIDIVKVLARGLQTSSNGKIRFTEDSSVQLKVARPPKEEPSQLCSQRGTGPLKILAVQRPEFLLRLQLQDLTQHHIVLVSTSIFSGPRYKDFMASASGGLGMRTEDRIIRLQSVVLRLCSVAAAGSEEQTWQQLLRFSPPLFEMIEWKRIVLDEFHEGTSWDYAMRTRLCQLNAVHKWGLTGTPPFGSPAEIAAAAVLLGYAAPPREFGKESFVNTGILGKAGSGDRHRSLKESFFNQQVNQQLLAKAAGDFVTRCARQNTTELVERICVVEHEELVWHTAEERLIYRQACHDHGVFNPGGYHKLTLESRAELLKRCAHFDMGEATSASTAIKSLGSSKRDHITKLTQQLWLEAARARVLSLASVGSDGGIGNLVGMEVALDQIRHPVAKSLVEQVLLANQENVINHLTTRCTAPTSERQHGAPNALAQSLCFDLKLLTEDGQLCQHPQVYLQQPIAEKEYYKDEKDRHAIKHAVVKAAAIHGVGGKHSHALEVLAHHPTSKGSKGRRTVMSAMSAGLTELGVLLGVAQRSLDFYTKQLSALTSQPSNCQECSICLGDLDDVALMAMLPCSHVFHAECIRASLSESLQCPQCRQAFLKTDVASVAMELNAPEPQMPAGSAAVVQAASPALRRHGSKLGALAARLTKIRREDPTAKALVFVQWVDLESKIWGALTEYSVPFLKISTRALGGVSSQDASVLTRFQNDQDSPFVLVLSLERAATGANLTAASHVVFVHPVNAADASTAAAYERQALARIRRIGQSRDEVHIWRFTTKCTIEDEPPLAPSSRPLASGAL